MKPAAEIIPTIVPELMAKSPSWDLRGHQSSATENGLKSAGYGDVGPGFHGPESFDSSAECVELEQRYTRAVQHCLNVPSKVEQIFVNPHPVSGSVANLAVLTALLEPGDTFLSFGAQSVGHFSLGGPLSFVSKIFHSVSLEPNRYSSEMDFGELLRSMRSSFKAPPKLVAWGASAYPRRADWAALREFADSFSPRPIVLVDISHFIGLISADYYLSPWPVAEIITFTTYKSLCGPPGAIIVTGDKAIHDQVRSALIPGLQDTAYQSSMEQTVLALEYACTPAFRDFQRRALTLGKVFAGSFSQLGIPLAFGGTDTHLVVVDLKTLGLPARDAVKVLAARGILCDPTLLPGDESHTPFGLRMGTIGLARAGCSDEIVCQIAVRAATLLHTASTDARRGCDSVLDLFCQSDLLGQARTSNNIACSGPVLAAGSS